MPYAKRVATTRTSRPPKDSDAGAERRGAAAAAAAATAAAVTEVDETVADEEGDVSIKVILRADVQGLGKRGDIVEVKDGYGRNFLLPRSLAIAATPGAVGQATAMRRSRDLKDAQDREAAQEIARTLVARTITITAKAGTEGRLFGSVTAADVVEAIAAQAGVNLESRQVQLDPIKTLGSHSVAIKLHADVEFPVSLEITPK